MYGDWRLITQILHTNSQNWPLCNTGRPGLVIIIIKIIVIIIIIHCVVLLGILSHYIIKRTHSTQPS